MTPKTRQLSNEHKSPARRKTHLQNDPSALVVKRGEYGAMLVVRTASSAFLHFRWKSHMTTGAGDAFAGGFMGYVAGCGQKSDAAWRPRHGLRHRDGQFTVEEFGPIA